jgi:putative aldouronate transport system permease protein
MMNTIVTMLILNMGSLFSVGYEKIYLMYNTLTYETADVISTYVYRTGLESMKYSYGAAIGLFNSVVNCLMLVIFNSLSNKISKGSYGLF